jgi:hypothetical protein
MTGTACPRADVGPAPPLTEGYEVLREAVLAGRAGGLGLALFLREGMAAWMRAWDGPRPGARVAAPPRRGSDAPAGGAHGAIVSVLAEMALSTYRMALP